MDSLIKKRILNAFTTLEPNYRILQASEFANAFIRSSMYSNSLITEPIERFSFFSHI